MTERMTTVRSVQANLLPTVALLVILSMCVLVSGCDDVNGPPPPPATRTTIYLDSDKPVSAASAHVLQGATTDHLATVALSDTSFLELFGERTPEGYPGRVHHVELLDAEKTMRLLMELDEEGRPVLFLFHDGTLVEVLYSLSVHPQSMLLYYGPARDSLRLDFPQSRDISASSPPSRTLPFNSAAQVATVHLVCKGGNSAFSHPKTRLVGTIHHPTHGSFRLDFRRDADDPSIFRFRIPEPWDLSNVEWRFDCSFWAADVCGFSDGPGNTAGLIERFTQTCRPLALWAFPACDIVKVGLRDLFTNMRDCQRFCNAVVAARRSGQAIKTGTIDASIFVAGAEQKATFAFNDGQSVYEVEIDPTMGVELSHGWPEKVIRDDGTTYLRVGIKSQCPFPSSTEFELDVAPVRQPQLHLSGSVRPGWQDTEAEIILGPVVDIDCHDYACTLSMLEEGRLVDRYGKVLDAPQSPLADEVTWIPPDLWPEIQGKTYISVGIRSECPFRGTFFQLEATDNPSDPTRTMKDIVEARKYPLLNTLTAGPVEPCQDYECRVFRTVVDEGELGRATMRSGLGRVGRVEIRPVAAADRAFRWNGNLDIFVSPPDLRAPSAVLIERLSTVTHGWNKIFVLVSAFEERVRVSPSCGGDDVRRRLSFDTWAEVHFRHGGEIRFYEVRGLATFSLQEAPEEWRITCNFTPDPGFCSHPSEAGCGSPPSGELCRFSVPFDKLGVDFLP